MNDYSEYFKNLKYTLESINQRSKVLKKIIEESWKPLREIEKSFEVLKSVSISNPIFKNPFENLTGFFQEIGEKFKKLIKETPDHVLKIAENGWFIEFDSELSLPSKLVNDIDNDHPEKADEYLSDYYTSNLDRVFDELTDRYPIRKQIFEEIIINHSQGNYFVAIPTILSQVDGICDHVPFLVEIPC